LIGCLKPQLGSRTACERATDLGHGGREIRLADAELQAVVAELIDERAHAQAAGRA
jgi:hypothetical protein